MDRQALLREAAEETLRRESESRRFLYKDVEALITRGMLTQTVNLDGNIIVFRTMTPAEIEHLLLRVEGRHGQWARFHIASSVHMVNGFAVEPQYGGNQAWHVYNEWVRDLHDEYVRMLYAYITGLRLRVERAIKITDAYCHEDYSRSMWRMIGPMEGDRNVIQKLWVAYNGSDDTHEADLRQWSHTRSLMGAMSGKAAKAVSESMKKWQQKREDRARRVIEETVNWIISGEAAEQEPVTVTINGETYVVPKVHASQTVEEMEDEMMRAVRGEKDYHDMLVDQYKQQQRRRLKEAREKQQEAVAAAWGNDEVGLQGETRFVGYTPEQLAEINPAMLNKKPNTRREAVSPEHRKFTEYIETDVQIGWLGANALPEVAKKKPAEGQTLQDKINRRTPKIKP